MVWFAVGNGSVTHWGASQGLVRMGAARDSLFFSFFCALLRDPCLAGGLLTRGSHHKTQKQFKIIKQSPKKGETVGVALLFPFFPFPFCFFYRLLPLVSLFLCCSFSVRCFLRLLFVSLLGSLVILCIY